MYYLCVFSIVFLGKKLTKIVFFDIKFNNNPLPWDGGSVAFIVTQGDV